jgi:hypothetical protein
MRFGGTYCLHFQDQSVSQVSNRPSSASCMWFAWWTVWFWSIALIFVYFLPVVCISYYLTLKMEPVNSFKTSAHFCQSSWSHISQKLQWSTAYQWFHHLKVCYPWQIVWTFQKCRCRNVEHMPKLWTLLLLEQVQYCHNTIFCMGWYTVLSSCWNLLQESVVYIYFFPPHLFYILVGPFIDFLVSGISIFYVYFLSLATDFKISMIGRHRFWHFCHLECSAVEYMIHFLPLILSCDPFAVMYQFYSSWIINF